jgi:group I intron endonuclease
MYIYKIVNLLNNKIYIGQQQHINKYYYGSGLLIKKAIKKYGKNNFIKEIICECNSREDLDEKEKYYIKLYNSTDKTVGYNLSEGGSLGGPLNKGHIHSTKSKNKMSDSQKKRIQKNGHNMIGFKHSSESIKKMSKAKKGKYTGKNNPMYGKHHTEESKRKMGVPRYGKNNPMYGNHHTKETKLKISKKITGKLNPFFGKNHSDATKYKISKSMIGKIPPNAKRIIINDFIYNSSGEASKILGIKQATILYRVKSKYFTNYNYIDK